MARFGSLRSDLPFACPVKQRDQTESGSAYRLTANGIELLPIMAEISLWSDAHFDFSDDLRSRIQAIKRDEAAFIAAIAETHSKESR